MKDFCKLLLVIFLFSVIFSFPVLGDYLDVSVQHTALPGGNITVEGHVYNQTGSGIAGVNVTGSMVSSTNSDVTDVNGYFTFNLTAPSTIGEYVINFTTNYTGILNKSVHIYVTQVASGSIDYTDKNPPFSAGTTFTINITLLNSTGHAIQNYLPLVEVFKTNGNNQTSWSIVNLSAGTNQNGVIQFNITIPSGVSGQYVIVVDRGAVFKVFEVGSGYVMAVNTETTEGENAFSFYPGETVMVVAKIRNSAGDPQTANSVKAFITLPNKTVVEKTLLSHPTYDGYYNNTFSDTNSPGEYSVRVEANVSGTLIEGYSLFEVKTFTAKLEEDKEFFFEWGGKGSFKPGEMARYNILIFNLSSGSIMTRGTHYECNSTYFNSLGLFYLNGTQVSGVDINFTPGQHMIDPICSVNFTVPTETGVYNLKINVTIGDQSDIVDGYFTVQNYFLKPKPVSDVGGKKDFEVMVPPGENVTIQLSAYNITGESEVDKSLIQNITVTKLIPLEFTQGIREYKLTEGVDYWVSGEGTDNPEVKVTVPSNIMGPALVEIIVNITGESVRGNAFFMANHVDGFLMPASGSPNDQGGPPVSSCSGPVVFSGTVQEVKTGDAAQGVIIQNIISARNEFTGEDMKNCLSILNYTPSNNEGQITAVLNFNSKCSFSGFHFLILNVTYKGKSAGLPAGVFCKKLNIWPRIRPLGSQEESWRIAPTSPIVVTIENITELINNTLIDNRSYVLVQRIHNFNPSEGENIFLANTVLNFSLDSQGPYGAITSNNVSFVLYPQNFSTKYGEPLTRWPNGFVDIEPSVCSPSIGGACDTGFAGFEVVAFDMWPEGWSWNAQYSTMENVTVTVSARTNISSTGGFTVRIGRPWEGEMKTAPITGISLLEDGWNDTSDEGRELWQINFTIPTDVEKGHNELIITGNNTNGETTDMHLWITIVKYKVQVPYEEGLEMDHHWIHVDNWNDTPGPVENTTDYGWNMTYLEENYGLNSSIGYVCLKDQLNVTRFRGDIKETIVYEPNTKVLIMDNHTGVFDTLILNDTTTGKIRIVTLDSRNFSVVNGSGSLYLWTIEACDYARIVNSTTPNTDFPWGGQWQVNTTFTIPLLVYKGTSDNPNFLQNAILGVDSISEREPGGFGFKEKLPEDEYSWSQIATDENGIAFLSMTVNKSGRYKVFWNVSYMNETDIATFDTGIEVEVKEFMTWGEPAYWLPSHLFSLHITNNTPPVWEAFTNSTAVPWVYNGSISEMSKYDFIRDELTTPTWYLVFNPYTNETILDDDMNFTPVDPQYEEGNYTPIMPPCEGGGECSKYTWNQSFEIDDTYTQGEGIRIGVNTYWNDTTSNIFYISFYQRDPPVQEWSINVYSDNQPVTVKVCAAGFKKPDPPPIEGAEVRLKMREWNGPTPTVTNLTLYNPINNTPVEYLLTGPTGCIAFNVTHPDGWPQGCNPIEGTVTSNGHTEEIYVVDVCRG